MTRVRMSSPWRQKCWKWKCGRTRAAALGNRMFRISTAKFSAYRSSRYWPQPKRAASLTSMVPRLPSMLVSFTTNFMKRWGNFTMQGRWKTESSKPWWKVIWSLLRFLMSRVVNKISVNIQNSGPVSVDYSSLDEAVPYSFLWQIEFLVSASDHSP